MNVNLRFFGFTLAVVFLMGLVGWAGQTAWQRLNQLRQNFGAMQRESFHRAEWLEASFLSLNETAIRYRLHRVPQDKSQFLEGSEELHRWIETQKTSMGTPSELSLLREIVIAFTPYLARTTHLLEAPAGTLLSPKDDAESGKTTAPILDLCKKLRTVERRSLNEFVENSHEAVGGLQQLLIALVVLVLVLGFTATSLIYRGKIAPLRAQLVESRAIIGRQEKLAALGTLAAGVAHEIRNPLTAINVRLHGLKKSLVPDSSEHEDATVIGQEIQRLDRIVRDVLQFARPAEPRLVAVNTESLFGRVRELLRAQLENASIRLDVSASPPLWIRVDPDQFDQVLINLVQNAAESIGKNGTITLRARTGTMPPSGPARHRFGTKASDPCPAVILEVIDTGAGIPKEVQDRLFDPFFTTKETGTGLGLSIAARIVEKHGGALQYETAVDCGTTFGIVLPRGKPRDEQVAGSHS